MELGSLTPNLSSSASSAKSCSVLQFLHLEQKKKEMMPASYNKYNPPPKKKRILNEISTNLYLLVCICF